MKITLSLITQLYSTARVRYVKCIDPLSPNYFSNRVGKDEFDLVLTLEVL